jgi:hypothetical protein
MVSYRGTRAQGNVLRLVALNAALGIFNRECHKNIWFDLLSVSQNNSLHLAFAAMFRANNQILRHAPDRNSIL